MGFDDVITLGFNRRGDGADRLGSVRETVSASADDGAGAVGVVALTLALALALAVRRLLLLLTASAVLSVVGVYVRVRVRVSCCRSGDGVACRRVFWPVDDGLAVLVLVLRLGVATMVEACWWWWWW